MSVELITSREQFLAIRENWESVYKADDEAQFFLSWQWLHQLFTRRSGAVFILCYRVANSTSDYRAFLPLRKEIRYSQSRRLFFNSYSMAGNYWADYTGLICDPLVENVAIPALADYLGSLPWYRVQLESLKMSAQRLNSFMTAYSGDDFLVRSKNLTDNHGETQLHKCPRIPLPETFETYLGTQISSNTRQKIRRFRRKLESDSSLQIRCSTRDTLDSDLEYFSSFWLAQWQHVKAGRAAKLAEKYVQIIRSDFTAGILRMPVLLQDNQPLGMLAQYIDHSKRTLLFFAGARNSSAKRLPIGLLLHSSSIEWAINSNLITYDLLRGDESYKYSLGALDLEITSKVVYQNKPALDCRILDPACVDEALSLLKSLQPKHDSKIINRIYCQLIESWPGCVQVLEHYAQWLHSTGQNQHAAEIRRDLTGGDGEQ